MGIGVLNGDMLCASPLIRMELSGNMLIINVISGTRLVRILLNRDPLFREVLSRNALVGTW